MTEFQDTIALANHVLDRPNADPDGDEAMLARQFLRGLEREDNTARNLRAVEKERDALRAALIPFAAAAGRPDRLVDCMTDQPLPDDAVLGLGVKVSAWKRAIELTGAE